MATKIEVLRKLIREEVKNAIREEMPGILKELRLIDSPNKQVIKETKSTRIPGTLNTKPFIPAQRANFIGTDPMSQLLNETAMTMGKEDTYAFTSDDVMADPTNFFQPQEVRVGDVNGMLSSARGSSAAELVQINEVPDFTGLMKSMMSKGII
jgi:hypothetical protein